MNTIDQFDWAVCIISSREEPDTLMSTLIATVSACRHKISIIDIVINGNICLAKDIEQKLELQCMHDSNLTKTRLWFIDQQDKANAFNQYIHNIWPGSDLTFFIDGYAKPLSDAFHQIDNKLLNNSIALGASAVPTIGHSANYLRKLMLSNGGIHGNLFAIKRTTLIELRKINFNLPLGIYRVDSTIAAAMAFNLDPRNNNWNPKERILVVPEATWSLPKKNDNIINKSLVFIKRKIRQEIGSIENLAIKEQFSILRKLPSDLPNNAKELIDTWMKNNRIKSILFLLTHPLALYAYLKIKPILSREKILPKLLADGGFNQKPGTMN